MGEAHAAAGGGGGDGGDADAADAAPNPKAAALYPPAFAARPCPGARHLVAHPT